MVIVLVTELSKKDTKLAALLLALPIISFTAYTMIWFESKDTEKIAKLANENFIYVLPVMPVLPLFSWLLKNKWLWLLHFNDDGNNSYDHTFLCVAKNTMNDLTIS
ncbi:MAG: hypothetical protein RLY73_545 [Pseudomonadota bacterium]